MLDEVVEGHPQRKDIMRVVLVNQAQNPGRGIRAPVQQRAVHAVSLVPAIADKAADETDLRGHHGRAGQRGHSYPAVRVTHLARRCWYLLAKLQVVLLHGGSARVMVLRPRTRSDLIFARPRAWREGLLLSWTLGAPLREALLILGLIFAQGRI